MSAEQSALRLEIGHVLFIDIIGYSKSLITEQSELFRRLTAVVRETKQFRIADAEGKLIRLPTGDGMALVFRNSPEAPVQCALELSKQLRSHPELRVRMGIHSGPVNEVADVNERINITGAGINIAQRVMDCGDAGHILLSKHVADDLEQYPQWRENLHELGQLEVKHGAKIDVVNFYNDEAGNAEPPEKFKEETRERKVMADRAASARRRKQFLIGAVLLMAIAASVPLWILFHRSPSNASIPISDKSVAVLPFENLSTNRENAFFADGMQDEVLMDLAKLADLKVISRTSVAHYRNNVVRNMQEIARELGVAYVVEGSVQRAGDRIRVTAQLIAARTDTHLWAEHYDRQIADVFAIQSEIAQQIADQLRAKISPEEKAAMTERPTADLQAYALYSEAKTIFGWGNWAGADKELARKVALLEKAIRRDSKFALAYCALAEAHDNLYWLTDDRKHLELAKNAADTALRLRPDLGQPHLELARYYYTAGNAGDFDHAYEELTIARRTLPNDSGALYIAGKIDRHRNRWSDSVAELQRASELDPNNPEPSFHLLQNYRLMRRYDLWKQLLQKNAGQRENAWDQLNLAQLKLDTGDPAGAQAVLAQIPQDFSPTANIWSLRFTVALYLRDYDAASRVIAATPAKFAEDNFGGQSPQSTADGWIARLRGDNEKAQAIFLEGRKRFDAKWRNEVKDQNYFVQAATFDAALGRKNEAIAEARQAVELLPIAKDSLLGPRVVANLAQVYASTGEKDRAIEQLEIVAKIPAGPTYGELKYDPDWGNLRGDPRFEKIVASLTPKDGDSK